jgi:tetratricopeptide (TPR) repeat protein
LLKEETPKFAESLINDIGYDWMINKNNYQIAIPIFKLNTELYPQAWNTFDSLGEAYMLNGQYQLSLINYSRSVELNPNNSYGIQQINKLKKLINKNGC